MIIPKNYQSHLDLLQTEIAIKLVKDTFERNLAKHLELTRVSAPLMVREDSGLNDDLNGVEAPISFSVKDVKEKAVIVHSLAKWKRVALKLYGVERFKGIYTDMNAIRKDEDLDNLHSIYVDQWDWEKVINKEDRTIGYLKSTVQVIINALYETVVLVREAYPELPKLIDSPEYYYIDSQELLNRYPDKDAKEREYLITKEHKVVFISKIGGNLSNGLPHDNRAPDYDDWQLNGDILVYDELLDCPVEISSMGIRVDKDALERQLKISNHLERKDLPYHKDLLEGKLPLTIGGGIGQSRLCLLILNKAHIGEVQASLWPKGMRNICKENNINLL